MVRVIMLITTTLCVCTYLQYWHGRKAFCNEKA
jgi:hypothetical protein